MCVGEPGGAKRCALCDEPVRALVDPVRMVGEQLATVCVVCVQKLDRAESLAGDEEDDDERQILAITRGQAAETRCGGCGQPVALHLARTSVGPGGAIEARCPACLAPPDRAPGVRTPSPPPPPPRPVWPRYAAALVVAGSVAATALLISDRTTPAAAALLTPRAPDREPAGEFEAVEPAGEAEWEREMVLPEDDVDPGPTVEDLLERSGGTIEEMLPTLSDWEFPVAGSEEAFPLRVSRQFGAERDGRRRPECGGGHCGVDLEGERGTPIVAVAWGRVSRIVHDEDRASGKYVKIEHPDFVSTYYMHLDSIADDLRVGDDVQPGQTLGALGSTGVLFSAPHLHFALEIPRGGALVHVDPAPYLRTGSRTER